jgi:hypothetical protein
MKFFLFSLFKESVMFIQVNPDGKITTGYVEVVPAYGRDYKSKKEVLADWKAEKDFQIASTGQYCSIRDFAVGVTVNLRYKKQTQVAPAKV